MPIFHDVYPRPPPTADTGEEEASDRHELERSNNDRSSSQGRLHSSPLLDGQDSRPVSRGELIERIKRRESPSWTIQHHLRQQSPRRTTPSEPSPRPRTPNQSNLLPAAEIAEQSRTVWHNTDIYQAGLEIERPRSALHSGDFRDQKDGADETRRDQTAEPLSISPPAPWSAAFPAAFRATRAQGLEPYVGLPIPQKPPSRSRNVSRASLSSSFQLLPPTSPLVQSSLNPDLDFSPRALPQRTHSPYRDNRRHTFSPQSFQQYQHNTGRFSTPPRAPIGLRREGTYPYQAHQPRRSISSLSQMVQQPSSSPQTPRLGAARRPSITSDGSPLHHAPMVGSYEESILRGRMSTTPSRPLDFVAQIGVLGKGKCKSSLRCPPHVTVPFPAVFYSYGTGSGRITDNQPSPYVGLIDLENNLKSAEKETFNRASSRRRTLSPDGSASESYRTKHNNDQSPAELLSLIRQRKLEHQKRRSRSPRQMRAPPGGSYRIPPIGQLQIVIKNPHKTAVKLFLVPYDLSDMEPGTKTFMRQRSYSAGPIIDMPLAARSNLGTDRPEASLTCSDDPRDRPVLRYLVHLNVCCLGKKGSERYYLYKSVRVVFANRVPDGKEKLRNEVQLPEPRYSVYKPLNEAASHPLLSQSNLAQELAGRRRSAAFPVEHFSLDAMDGIAGFTAPSDKSHTALEYVDLDTFTPIVTSVPSGLGNSFHFGHAEEIPPIPPLPLGRRKLDTVPSRPESREAMDIDMSDTNSRSTDANSQFNDGPTSPVSPLSYRSYRRSPNPFVRNGNGNLELSEGVMSSPPMEFKRSESPSLSGRATPEGLLSRRLRNRN